MKQKKKKGKITLSFASPDKEIYFFIYQVITWEKRKKSPDHNYSLSDGSQCGIGIRASDHVVVIIAARIWLRATG
jgi:hypothetical protein